jgi:hypothetical protein
MYAQILVHNISDPFQFIMEDPAEYRVGGFHPVAVGDMLGGRCWAFVASFI